MGSYISCLSSSRPLQIQYEGSDCRRVNFWYHVSFASIFSLVALTSLIQLVMCVHAEYIRLGGTSSKKQQQGGGGGLLWRACRVTTQKLLYLLIFLASLLRGAYFATAPTVDSKQLSASLMSAYYPLVLSGASLIVCFWAEVFHLREVRWDRPRFLSKSFLGFLAFNVITYSLLTAELMLVWMGGDEEGGSGAAAEGEEFYKSIFNGCYAVLMFVVVVFFLIYGVEVFFKVRGGFTVPVVAGVIASVPQQQQLQQQQPLRSEDEERQHRAEKRRKRRMEEGEAEAEEVVATLENEEEDGPASSRRGSSSKQDEEEKKKFNDEGAEGKRRRAAKRLRINSGDEVGVIILDSKLLLNTFFRTALLQALLLLSSSVLSGGAAGGHQHEPAAPVEARATQPGAHDDGHGRLPLLRDAGAVLEDKVSSTVPFIICMYFLGLTCRYFPFPLQG